MIDPNNLVKLKHPELKKEWDVDKNHDIKFDLITCGSNKKYWWICSKNHSWQASPNKRCNSGRGCPFCNGNNTILPGENDLQTLFPDIAKEWHPTLNDGLTPDMIRPQSEAKKIWWLCPEGHEYQAMASSRTRATNSTGCPICTSRSVLEGFNDLATVRPDLAKEWDVEKNNELGLKATEVTKCSNKKAWWICSKCGNQYYQQIKSRTLQGSSCPKCGKILGEKHRMETVHKKNATHL